MQNRNTLKFKSKINCAFTRYTSQVVTVYFPRSSYIYFCHYFSSSQNIVCSTEPTVLEIWYM